MTRRRTGGAPSTPGGAGAGTGYGCPCGEHVGIAATTDEAIAAVRECPGPPQRAGRARPVWMTPPPADDDGQPERTP